MALTKAKKAVKIDQLTHELEGSTSAIVGTFAKLTVSQDFELRKVVRGAGGRYRVVKNKLAALAKALSTWMQENAEFTFKLGIIDGQVITVEEVKQLATMPSKEQIFSKLLFLINAPAQLEGELRVLHHPGGEGLGQGDGVAAGVGHRGHALQTLQRLLDPGSLGCPGRQ